jgi:putative ABC transport system permease protein
MPRDVRFLPSFGEESCPTYDVNARVDYWLPVEPDLSAPKGGSGNGPWSVVGRLRGGASLAQAQAELAAISARQAQANSYYKGLTVKVQPLTEFLNRDGRRLLLPLLAAVALVFLIACGNIAALLLARGLSRQQEYAVRCALGAGRARLFRQVLTETLLLALLGGSFGLGLAVAMVGALKAMGGFAIPRLDAVTIGWPMLAFCFVSAIVAAILAGFLPALRAARLDPAQATKTSAPTSSVAQQERYLLSGITTLQTAMTLALLVGACLLIQTVVNLANLRPGYETQNILTMSVMKEFRRGTNNDFHRRALERISALPDVKSAAFIWGLPLTGNQWAAGEVTVVGRPPGPFLAERPQISACCVTEQYFDAMGMRVVAGRAFRASDIAKKLVEPPAVVIINQAMARRFFPGENPLGKKLFFQWTSPRQPSVIVGVVADSRDTALTQKPEPELYFSMWQLDVLTKTLVVRTTTDPRGLIGAVRHQLQSIDPAAAIVDVKTMSRIRAQSVASQTFAMRLLSGFSLVATVLAMVGIYGVLSLSTNSRKREIAIRIAVGAQRRSIRGLVLADGLKLIAWGLLAGAGLAMPLARVLRVFLFGVGPTDLTTFVLVAAAFTAVAMLACYLPARRATRADPMTVLRYD